MNQNIQPMGDDLPSAFCITGEEVDFANDSEFLENLDNTVSHVYFKKCTYCKNIQGYEKPSEDDFCIVCDQTSMELISTYGIYSKEAAQ